ncbi:MAG: hypothetical protein HIU57_07805 [Acidobacteria bacterium]|nr:hypothetical protein [Acidobacteriota bacterium]
MHSTYVLLLAGSLAYLGTMVDNLFAFASQLVVTPRERFPSVTVSQSVGVAVLVAVAVVVGTSLNVVPLRAVAILALAPWGLAWHQWRQRASAASPSVRRGAATTFVVTVGLGADNLAVWIPLLRANGGWRQLALVAIFSLWQLLFVALSWRLATHPRVLRWGQRSGEHVVPWLYVVLGVAILFECGVL